MESALRFTNCAIKIPRPDPVCFSKFIRWLSEYDTGPSEGRSLARHNDWLSNRNCKVVRVEGDLTVKERIELVSKYIA